MCSEDLGVQLLFIPEEHGGMGGSAFDVYQVLRAGWPTSTDAERGPSSPTPVVGRRACQRRRSIGPRDRAGLDRCRQLERLIGVDLDGDHQVRSARAPDEPTAAVARPVDDRGADST